MSNPKVPTALNIIRGNPGKRPLNKREPQGAEWRSRPPAYLDADAKKCWRIQTAKLLRMRVLTDADAIAMENLCTSYSRMVRAQRELAFTGKLLYPTKSGYIQKSPLLEVIKSEMQMVNKILLEFGMTASARSRIALPPERKPNSRWQDD